MILRLVSLLCLALIAMLNMEPELLLGTVTDTSGAVVAGARVSLAMSRRMRSVNSRPIRPEIPVQCSPDRQLCSDGHCDFVQTGARRQSDLCASTRSSCGCRTAGRNGDRIDRCAGLAPLIQTNTAAVGTVVDNRTVRNCPSITAIFMIWSL